MSVEERVPVVAAFAYRDDKVILIKRSEKVRTYQGSWSAFSGYMERLPLNQARTELLEEAGLIVGHAHLRGIGIPFPIDDDNHRWLVFPFLFRLEDGIEIKTDWETDEWGWFAPEDFAGLKTVPGLRQALDRVWPPFGDQEFWAGLEAVAGDTDHGATELARRGLVALGGYVQANDQKLDREQVLKAVRAFAACRPSLGVFPNLAARLLLAIEREGGEYDLDALITELLSAVEDSTDLTVAGGIDCLRQHHRLFTLSYSEAVRDTILGWHGGEKEVVVAESLPKKEGIQLAQFLCEHGVNARTISDSDIEAAVGEVDAVVVGCDALTSTHLMNKIGTRQAVMKAKEAGIAAYAVAQAFKVLPPDWPVFLEPQAPADFDRLAKDEKGGPVFDLTPLDAFSVVNTEDGWLTNKMLAEIQSELASVELIPALDPVRP
ncbi:MAG TPA: NUDIX domain-containing protein [Armatimonadota bacterium]|nr:NUDIX domain-containing protein [Armatimonadota bacterium]